MMKWYCVLLLIIILLLSLTLVSLAGPGIIISEVYYNALGSDYVGEWIELYNPTLSTVNIGGYFLKDNSSTYTIANGTSLLSGQVMIFARDDDGFFNLFNFYPDFGDLNLSLSNSKDMVTLEDSGNNQIDLVAWGNYISGWNLSAGEGKSLQRISFGYTPSDWAGNATPDPGNHSPLPNPIPEPGTLFLLGSGLLSIFAIQIRRRKKI